MKPVYFLPLISVIVLQPSIAHALTPEQIQKVARSVVLKISAEGEEKSIPSFGSGVLVQKVGTTYTLVTNAHVVCTNGSAYNCKKHKEFSITTPDKKIHKVKSAAVKNLPELDLSIIQFQSDQNYSVASFGDSDTVKVDDPIYASGFPVIKNSFSFNHGTIIASVKDRIENDNNGYTVFYDASTNKGMSGGGVFNSQGKLVAIHGQGDRWTNNSLLNKGNTQANEVFGLPPSPITKLIVGQKIGINRGIPVKYLQASLSSRKLNSDIKSSSADSWFVIALNKFINDDEGNTDKNIKEAIQACSEAIKLKPDYLMAYYIRGQLWEKLDVIDKALNDYRKISQLQPSSIGTYLASAYAKLQLGRLNTRLGKSDVENKYINEALIDTNKAIAIDSKYPFSYIVRSNSYQQAKKMPLAIADLNQAIAIDSKNSLFYLMRAFLYLQAGKQSSAIQDLDQVIELEPSDDSLFFVRAQAKLALSDKPGAIADIKQAISIREDNSGDTNAYRIYLASLNNNQPQDSGVISLSSQELLSQLQPDSAPFYLTRAAVRQSKKDLQGALADYDQAIILKPNALSFMSRAIFKQQDMKDYQGAEEDYTRAINLKPKELMIMLYTFRGGLRLQNIQNKKGAITDFQAAERICKQSSNNTECLYITNIISSIN
jgi:tetratricopeptide (TPR) repeat protein